MPQVWVGTSGWSYPEWVGHFYPNGTTPSRMLPFYASRFPVVEAHASYRRQLSASALDRWVRSVPPHFRFAPKAHMGISHRRDMSGVEERVAAFFDGLGPLGSHLGPVLCALPQRAPDLARLDRLLAILATEGRPPVAFQLGPAWIVPDVLRRLEARGVTLVLVEADGRDAPDIDVGPITYVRLRRTRYTRAHLDGWAERLAKVTSGGREAYAFFRHDAAGDGPRYARHLMGRLKST